MPHQQPLVTANVYRISQWRSWLPTVAPALERKEKVPYPAWLPHPQLLGFQLEPLAEPAGQIRDWVLRLANKSRLHAHEHPDGSITLHWDKYDPDSDLPTLVKHLVFETKMGPIAAVGIFGLVVYGAARMQQL